MTDGRSSAGSARKNVALALALLALVALFYVITLVRDAGAKRIEPSTAEAAPPRPRCCALRSWSSAWSGCRLRLGAALPPVLPGDRFRRHDAGGAGRPAPAADADGRCPLQRRRHARPALGLPAGSAAMKVRLGEQHAGLLPRDEPIPTSRWSARPRYNVTPFKAGPLFRQAAVLLLRRAAAGGRAEGRYAGLLLRRSGDADGPRRRSDVGQITLSYTFYIDREARSQAGAPARLDQLSDRGERSGRAIYHGQHCGHPTTTTPTARPRSWHGPSHPYHLVDPSPWPLVGALSPLLLAGGGVMYMHGNGSAAGYAPRLPRRR